MTFLDTIPYNSIWFGCETDKGKTVWSHDFLEILRHPDRKRFTPIYEKPFSEIRGTFSDIELGNDE